MTIKHWTHGEAKAYKPELHQFGFAAGNYMCRCVTCEGSFDGDKRAVRCEPCSEKLLAVQTMLKDSSVRIGEAKPDPDPIILRGARAH